MTYQWCPTTGVMEMEAALEMSTEAVTTPDGVTLHTESVGSGEPILFIHEFAGDHRTWEPQIRRFSRSHRCITYGARGYPPSEVPADPAVYSQQHAVDDAIAVLDAHSVGQAHVVGISMGGFCGLHLAMAHPGRVRSLVAAGTGYGARPHEVERFRGECDAIAEVIETAESVPSPAKYMSGPSRVTTPEQGSPAPGGVVHRLGERAFGGGRSSATMRGVQRGRPSLYALEAELAAITAPVLVLAGDEDDGSPGDERVVEEGDPTAGPGRPCEVGSHTEHRGARPRETLSIVRLLPEPGGGRRAGDQRDPRADPGAITGFS